MVIQGIFFVILLLAFTLKSEQFIYPVACDNQNLYLIYQKKSDFIQLWVSDFKHKTFEKGLYSMFLPGNFTLLPSKKGFSFIDQGCLRIKYFNKRSPKTINFLEPIFRINQIEWIDDKSCYFSARKNRNDCVFHVNINENKLYCIQESSLYDKPKSDYLYPQKVDSMLFCIERIIDGKYKTAKTYYKIIQTNYSACTKTTSTTESKKVILNCNSIPIVFLKMISDSEGFFIEHPIRVDSREKLVMFSYHHLFKENDLWSSKELFTFLLPLQYIAGNLLNNKKLYESILPFLPKFCEDSNKIFFCHCDDEINLSIDIYCYDMLKNKIDKKTQALESQVFLSPLIFDKTVFYGEMLQSEIFKYIPRFFNL